MKNYQGFFYYNRGMKIWKPFAIWHRFGLELQPYGIILVSNGIFSSNTFYVSQENTVENLCIS